MGYPRYGETVPKKEECMMQSTLGQVLVVKERADEKYGRFASTHEAYGVLAEELEEDQ